MITFEEFPKIPRLTRECVVTEKIDGTNAQVHIRLADADDFDPVYDAQYGDLRVRAGSRQRWLSPEKTLDNYGFAAWVRDNLQDLARLGVGRHYGEWWGQGCQRGYGLAEKRFSLFNTSRWLDDNTRPVCCHVVPVLATGVFSSVMVEGTLMTLREFGSAAAPGFMKPEGVVVYHTAVGNYFKKTCEHDDEPKNAHIKKVREAKPPRDPNIGGRRKGLDSGYVGEERREP